jgi:hypothetical protein
MPSVQTASPQPRTRSSVRRDLIRWMVTFLGFPLGGVLPWLAVGPVDGLGPALFGGLVTGAVLGAVQSWGLGRAGTFVAKWTAATGLGLLAGLAVGASAVGYETTLTALVIQGAISGIAVGAAQGWVLRSELGQLALAWPLFLAVVWAAGWAVTTSAGIGVDEQFTVFGSSGALVVTFLTAVLPLTLTRLSPSAGTDER